MNVSTVYALSLVHTGLGVAHLRDHAQTLLSFLVSANLQRQTVELPEVPTRAYCAIKEELKK